MNLTIARERLLLGLQAVQSVVGGRTTLPILSNVLLQAKGDRLELTATDLDVTITSAVEAGVRKEGATTLPVKRLFGIVKELTHPEVEMEADDRNFCAVRSGSSFFKVRGLGAEEFPPLPRFPEEPRIVLPQDKVRSMIRRTAFAMSADETRYVLNGIFVSLKEHKLTMVATDGRRLAMVDEEVDVPEKSQGEFILPAKAVNELSRLLQDKGEVEITFTENQAALTLKGEQNLDTVVVTKLIEGTYPNYRQVIPAEAKERVSLSREEFMHALRRAQLMTSEKQNSVKLNFTKNNLAITANSPDVGEARESLAVNYKGKDLAIAFNPDYVIDPLNALTEEEVFLELTDELSPGVIKVNGPFLYVVMPMRLS